MNRCLLPILSVIFLIGIISAQVSVSPSTINLGNVFPGDTYSRNLTVSSDGNYLLHFNSSSYILISPDLFNVSNGDNITINITISEDAPTGSFNLDTASYIVAEDLPVSPSSSNSGGSGSYGNPVVVYNNTMPNISNETTCSNGVCPINVTNENPKETVKKPYLFPILIIAISLSITLVLLIILKKRNIQLKGGLEDDKSKKYTNKRESKSS